MNAVEIKVLNQAVAQLKAIKCAFKIISPDGKEVLEDPQGLFSTKSKRSNPRRVNRTYEHGELSKHYLPYVENIAVGEVAKIPYTDKLPCLAIQSSLCAWMSKRFGVQSYTSLKNRKEKVLEVLRVK